MKSSFKAIAFVRWAIVIRSSSCRNKMVWWSFTYKPELEGAYCLTVRATTESGMTSFETQTVMFNAKDKMPNPEDTTVLESASLIPPKVAAASDEKSE